jgi:hypothetical protein
VAEPYLALITPLTGHHPAHPIAPGGTPGHPDNALPATPGAPTHPIVPPPPDGGSTLPASDWTLVYAPGSGWMWAKMLAPAGGGHPGNALPTPPSGTLPAYPGNRPDNTLPPTAAPKK